VLLLVNVMLRMNVIIKNAFVFMLLIFI